MAAFVQSAAFGGLRGDSLDVDALALMHAERRLMLVFRPRPEETDQPFGYVVLEADAQALVSELIKMARFGVAVRDELRANPGQAAKDLVRAVDTRGLR